MNEWTIKPFEGLGDLHFGMSRSEIRAVLGNDFESIKEHGSLEVMDAYQTLRLHLCYDSEDRLEFIEATAPCDPVYHGMHFFGRDVENVLTQLSELGIVYEEDIGGYDVPELGLGLYIPHESLQAISVYRKGYYDQLRG